MKNPFSALASPWPYRQRGLQFLRFLSAALFAVLVFPIPSTGAAPAATRLIRDMAGREVRIPQTPRRIACLHGPSYEKIFALDGADRVAMVANLLLPWAHQLNPALARIPAADTFAAPDVEQLMQMKVDLVIYPPFQKQLSHLQASGLPVVVPYDSSRRPTSLEGFIADYYTQIRFYGELLGGTAPSIADAYCTYVDARLRQVIAVTSAISANERPRVFYFCGPVGGPAGTQTQFSTAYWLVTAAGGVMLTHDDPSYFVAVSSEQMILWDPDIIVVSTLTSIDPVVGNPQWHNLRAVREKKVLMSPQGIFYWSHFSTESFLCILFLAKQFYPDRFPDLDIQHELKAYYSRFYHYDLTDNEAQRILSHLPPRQTP